MRKRFLPIVLLAATAVAAISAPPASAQSVHRQCRATGNDRAPELCVVGVPSTAMNAAFQYQRTPVWCWAASMAMILAYYHRPVSQGDIVSAIFGTAVPSTLPANEVMPYLDHTYVDRATGTRATTRAAVLYAARSASTNLPMILDELAAGRPLLVFTPHHAMVMTALYYYADRFGNVLNVAGIVVRDPFPYAGGLSAAGIAVGQNPGERLLSTSAYDAIEYVFVVTVA